MSAHPADNAKIVRVAPGQLLTLYGTKLAPTGVAPAAATLPVSLNGVSVTFNGIAAPPLFTSDRQINLQASGKWVWRYKRKWRAATR
jgi:uncharacterized protein (TIGR03437 family)